MMVNDFSVNASCAIVIDRMMVNDFSVNASCAIVLE